MNRLVAWLIRLGVGVPGHRDQPAAAHARLAAARHTRKARELEEQHKRAEQLARVIDLRWEVLSGESGDGGGVADSAR